MQKYNAPLYKSRTQGTMNHAYEANKEEPLLGMSCDCYEEHVPRPKLENSYGEENENARGRITF